ncbi:succinate dehydrogenase, cytochrome b556 subunit [Paralimibaculum aggregatum]|uniref:Succinate dehydrogenase cytochrome b556 subunit n=1 Tax=Paralimibaculum aggregatum TaxID=3036245 RepID=A0ABQ6LS07_9RHOB|nr:succinate dehydrogenase [Limibaculum sp. NKW23]GMG84848.1 succinate dehydrogenase, cytochrome b556 subunit [Limibaculum sp. NKW23]
MIRPHRRHPLWFAFILHRVSGLALALFLPAHFLMLGSVLEGAAALDAGLAWTDNLLAKIAEFGLVFLLAVHLFGGLRLMALEFLPWSPAQKTMAAASVALAVLVSGGFFLQAV